jgi:hypothetical protein
MMSHRPLESYQPYTQTRPVRHGEIELRGDRDPVAWVPDAYGQMVPMRRSQLPDAPARAQPRDLTPQPVFDPVAQRLAAAGAGGGVLLWGGGQFLAGLGQLVSGLSGVGVLLLFLALAGGRAFSGRREGGTVIEVHNHNRGFGRSTTNL